MTGRPSLPVGAYGKITITEVRPRVWEALTRVRDPDGETRKVKRTGRSKTAAENNLKAALADRRHNHGDITGDTRVSVIGERWFEQLEKLAEAGDIAHRTLATYESAWRLHVKPGLGELRAREATPARCDPWLEKLREKVGPSMCATSRAVLSGVMGLAVRRGAIDANPVRELSKIPGSKSRVRKPRAMTPEEIEAWLNWVDNNVAEIPRKPDAPPRAFVKRRSPEMTLAIARDRALGDISRFMLGVGCRPGETMAVSWDEVNLDDAWVDICWHLVRVTGKGLIREPGAKSEAGDRRVALPGWTVDMLGRRRAHSQAYPIFPDSLGGWRDPNLVMRWIRWSRDEAGFEWLTSYNWRQTVAHLLDAAGRPTREVADQLGHSRIEQSQGYMQRKITSERAAEVLDALGLYPPGDFVP